MHNQTGPSFPDYRSVHTEIRIVVIDELLKGGIAVIVLLHRLLATGHMSRGTPSCW